MSWISSCLILSLSLPGPQALWYDRCWNWALSHLQHIPLYLGHGEGWSGKHAMQKSGDPRIEQTSTNMSQRIDLLGNGVRCRFSLEYYLVASFSSEIPQNQVVIHYDVVDKRSQYSKQPWLVLTIKKPKKPGWLKQSSTVSQITILMAGIPTIPSHGW